MATIAQIVAQIRTAIYGKDVRENIAQGIEKCYEDSTANAQIQEIINKGQETLDSIPEDYTALTGEVDDLKSALSIITENNLFKPTQWTKGTINGTGAEVTNDARIRSGFIHVHNEGLVLSVHSGLVCGVVEFKSDKSTVVRQAYFSYAEGENLLWKDDDTEYIRIVAKNTAGDSTILPTDGDSIHIYEYNTLLKEHKATVEMLKTGNGSSAVIEGQTKTVGSDAYADAAIVDAFWINGDGEPASNSSCKYAIFPVISGEKYQICYGANTPAFSKNASGAWIVKDQYGNTVQTIAPENLPNGATVNGYSSKIVQIPSNGFYFALTVKLTTSWDRSASITANRLTYSGGSLVSLFGSEISDKTSRNNIQILKKDVYPTKASLADAFSKNRYNGLYSDGYLDSNGKAVVYSDWKTTDFVYVGDLEKVSFSVKVISSGNRERQPLYFLCTYDANLNFIEQVGESVTTPWTVPSGVKYIRFCFHYDPVTELQVEEGTTISAYSAYTSDGFVKKYNSEIKEISDTIDEIYTPSKNIYIEDECMAGYISDSTGELVPNVTSSGWITTPFKPRNGNHIVMSGEQDGSRIKIACYFLSEYDSDKEWIKTTSVPSVNGVDLDDDTAFIRFCTQQAQRTNYSNIQAEFASSPTAYEAPKHEIKENVLSVELQEKIDYGSHKQWHGKKWVCLGDSLTEVNLRTTKHYHDYVSELTGISVVNMGVSGSGYMRLKDESKAFYQRAANIPTDADVITIFGSGNDLALGSSKLGTPEDTGTTTICGCMNETIDVIIGNNPIAQLGIVAPTPWAGHQPPFDDSDDLMASYVECLRQICKHRSIPFLDLYHSSNLRPWTEEGREACYSKDEGNGVHPDEAGHKLIAGRFKAFLESLVI